MTWLHTIASRRSIPCARVSLIQPEGDMTSAYFVLQWGTTPSSSSPGRGRAHRAGDACPFALPQAAGAGLLQSCRAPLGRRSAGAWGCGEAGGRRRAVLRGGARVASACSARALLLSRGRVSSRCRPDGVGWEGGRLWNGPMPCWPTR